MTVASISAHLAGTMHAVTPVHPGWNGTPRPNWYTGVDDLALTYLNLLQDRDLRDVVLVGSSVGGWIAAEMAVRDVDAGRVAGVVLLDSMGIEVPGEPIRDFFALDAHGVAEYSFHDGTKFYVDPASVPAEQAAAQAANMQTLGVYAGEPYMHDPKLRRRLARVDVPVLVAWGDSDRIATPAYGAAFAQSFSNAEFELIADAGHLPHIEAPDVTFELLDSFLAGLPAPR